MEYIFHNTFWELDETYEYLDRLEAILGKPVLKSNPENVSIETATSLVSIGTLPAA